MKIIKEMPENAEDGSKWLVMRQNGEVTFSTVSNTYFYEGDASSSAAVLDVIHDGEGNLNRVAYYMPLTEETEKAAPSVGSDLKFGVSIDHEALTSVLHKLDHLTDMLKQLPEARLIEYRRRDAATALRIIEAIKTDILE